MRKFKVASVESAMIRALADKLGVYNAPDTLKAVRRQRDALVTQGVSTPEGRARIAGLSRILASVKA